jgi:hypothetical protein
VGTEQMIVRVAGKEGRDPKLLRGGGSANFLCSGLALSSQRGTDLMSNRDYWKSPRARKPRISAGLVAMFLLAAANSSHAADHIRVRYDSHQRACGFPGAQFTVLAKRGSDI